MSEKCADNRKKDVKITRLRNRLLIPLLVLNLFYIVPVAIMFLTGMNKSMQELYTNLAFKSSILYNEINAQCSLLSDSNSIDKSSTEEAFRYLETYAEKKIITTRETHEIAFAVTEEGEYKFFAGLGWENTTPARLDKQALQTLQAKRSTEIDINGRRYIAMGLPFTSFDNRLQDWRFTQVIAREKEFFLKEIYNSFYFSAVIILATVFIVALLILFVLRKTMKAVESLTETINDVYTNLRFDYSLAEIKDNTEISHLTATFGKMLKRIDNYSRIIIQSIFEAVLSRKTEEKLRILFQKYVPDELVRRMLLSSSKVIKGTVKRPIILFSDIRSFTTLSEQNEAHVVSEALNRYFSLMNDEIARRKGIVDKFIGDAIMALFNALDEHETDQAAAEQAVLCAINMHKILKDAKVKVRSGDAAFLEFFNYGLDETAQQAVARLFLNFNTGIGLSTGEVIVGDIGSEKKMDFTAIGDKVNEASRLEGMTKYYACPILISENTQRLLVGSSAIYCIELDAIYVKGKHEPTTLYYPIEREHFPLFQTDIENYAKGLELYRKAGSREDWEEALKYFSLVDSEKLSTAALIGRIKGQAPPPGWAGNPFYAMDSK